jgi:colanic acid/amylovoran biosynthesis protein
MNHGTPALTVAYEHKSTGTMQQLGLGDLDIEMEALLDGSASRRVIDLLQSLESLNDRTAKSVEAERERARRMLERLLTLIRSRM